MADQKNSRRVINCVCSARFHQTSILGNFFLFEHPGAHSNKKYNKFDIVLNGINYSLYSEATGW